ncbi:MAG: selenide,water dikinase [Oceanospirillaceae bacterium]|jgi:selenide,water dikinase
MKENEKPRLTEYSHSSGCGCKIAPAVLKEILGTNSDLTDFPSLLVGNHTNDDAAVWALDNENVVISTTDFFMPIVDDPFDFGGIASANAISDIYAMGGKPIMAIAILGWPVEKLSPKIAAEVLAGAKAVCAKAGIPLAGGHSIDSPEPIFGLAVTGTALRKNVKENGGATVGCELFLTKPLGVGVLSTAMKRGKLLPEDEGKATEVMLQLNTIGAEFGKLDCVKAITDVTGFGLLGHLTEMCEASGLSAEIDYLKVPLIDGLKNYLDQFIYPDMTMKNFNAYGQKVSKLSGEQLFTLCDPQTSGGLLVAVDPNEKAEFLAICKSNGLELEPIGRMTGQAEPLVQVV